MSETEYLFTSSRRRQPKDTLVIEPVEHIDPEKTPIQGVAIARSKTAELEAQAAVVRLQGALHYRNISGPIPSNGNLIKIELELTVQEANLLSDLLLSNLPLKKKE